jgi:SAM-dependent methyltransferase
VTTIDGVDFTAQMLGRARARGVYRSLYEADVRDTRLPVATYDLITEVLGDEHLADLSPLYSEVARLLSPGGSFVIVGYHSHFLMSGIPTHFDSASGEPLAIESYVHLFSDHVQAAFAANLQLIEMHEGVVDEEWLAKKPQWRMLLNHPVSFAMAWRKKA